MKCDKNIPIPPQFGCDGKPVKESNSFLHNVRKRGNPWLVEKCEGCSRQILSYSNLGLASYFCKDDDDPWSKQFPDHLVRYVCIRCSITEGYDG